MKPKNPVLVVGSGDEVSDGVADSSELELDFEAVGWIGLRTLSRKPPVPAAALELELAGSDVESCWPVIESKKSDRPLFVD